MLNEKNFQADKMEKATEDIDQLRKQIMVMDQHIERMKKDNMALSVLIDKYCEDPWSGSDVEDYK